MHAAAGFQRLVLVGQAQVGDVGVEVVGGGDGVGGADEAARPHVVGGHGVQVQRGAVP